MYTLSVEVKLSQWLAEHNEDTVCVLFEAILYILKEFSSNLVLDFHNVWGPT